MAFPGPEFGPWALLLPLWAIGIAILGEAVRLPIAQFSRLLAKPRPIERLLIDLYLGGAVIFVTAALPFGLFVAATVPALLVAGVVALIAYAFLGSKRPGPPLDLRRFVRGLARPMVLVALLASGALFLIELWAAMAAPTGNTFDSSLLAFYVARLMESHSIPTSFLPASAWAVPYPQGTTVWLATYQIAFGLPPPRTSILVTPLFAGLAPLGAFVVGDRMLGRPSSGAVLALVFAFVGSWTRVMAAGSNDFVVAFPLLLLLIGRAPDVWLGEELLPWGEAVAFGGLAGIGATLSPVGPIWLYPTLLAGSLLAPVRFGGRPTVWLSRWFGSLLVGVGFALPSLYQELFGVGGHLRGGLPVGAVANPAAAHPGISLAQFVGLVDPYLVRATDVWFSPFPFVRDELIVLLTIGALLLALPFLWPERLRETRPFARFALAGGAVAVLILLSGLADHLGASFLSGVDGLTSLAETSVLLFVLYTMVAAVPIVVLVRYAESATEARPAGRPNERAGGAPMRARSESGAPIAAMAALALAGLLLAPGAITTGTSLVGYESHLYEAFGNVSRADFDLLNWVHDHGAPGARVLVAQGSAAEFLLGSAPRVVVLYPMIDGVFVNASYELVSRELVNGTLDGRGEAALAVLQVDLVAITGSNNQLFPPWSADPFLGSPPGPGRTGFLPLFHEDDAFLFERVPAG